MWPVTERQIKAKFANTIFAPESAWNPGKQDVADIYVTVHANKITLARMYICQIRLYIQKMYVHEIMCGHYVPAPLSWGVMSFSVSAG